MLNESVLQAIRDAEDRATEIEAASVADSSRILVEVWWEVM